MSKAASSPTARLLQSSRLFSLPRPLPQPTLENVSSTGVYRASDTATLPYPTHQAIATPASSHHRGDWGLKRPLPGRATKSSTPHIRVNAQDTAEHVTDFGSAADHTQTAVKWREMGVPLVMRQGNDRTSPISVFEEALDNTNAGTTSLPGSRSAPTAEVQGKIRWKHSGPWLAGMQDGEFELFLDGLLSKKAPDGTKGPIGRSELDRWKENLKSHIVDQAVADRRRQLQESGEVLSPRDEQRLRKHAIPTDAQLRLYEKHLRDRHLDDGLSSELTSLICNFLDLPAVESADSAHNNMKADIHEPLLRGIVSSLATDNDMAPPSTHPSAGLSYLRTNAWMENHPIHGPQAHHSPVLARVVRFRASSFKTAYQAAVGMGGVVANDPNSRSLGSAKSAYGSEEEKTTMHMDPDLPDGNKIWMQNRHASIDEQGRIQLKVVRADREAISVRTGDVEHIHESRAASSRSMSSGPVGSAAFPPGTPRNANYGSGLPGPLRSSGSVVQPRSGVAPLDQGATDKIRAVLEQRSQR